MYPTLLFQKQMRPRIELHLWNRNENGHTVQIFRSHHYPLQFHQAWPIWSNLHCHHHTHSNWKTWDLQLIKRHLKFPRNPNGLVEFDTRIEIELRHEIATSPLCFPGKSHRRWALSFYFEIGPLPSWARV